MKIDGKAIAQQIFDDLKQRVIRLRNKGVTAHLAMILIGDDEASKAYVRQKVQKGEGIGANVTIHNLPQTVSQDRVLRLLKKLNTDNTVHGIIVQRPLPDHIDEEAMANAVLPEKDVDGFHPQTKFGMPLATAVLKILEDVLARSHLAKQGETLKKWLMTKNIVVMGKGKTGGGPVISALAKLGVEPLIVDSKTQNPKLITKNADIIISAVGKPNMVKSNEIKKDVILISVGLHKGSDGKLHGDYEEKDVKDIVAYYTPTPGGVGPVNVAVLLENVVKAAENFAGG